jgi:hypothetical protein
VIFDSILTIETERLTLHVLGYDAENPVGGIELPLVTCNNLENEWKSGKVFKLYTDNESKNCRSYKRPDCKSACQDACQAQFDECKDIYAEGCKTKGKVNGKIFGGFGWWKQRRSYFEAAEVEKRTFNRFNSEYNDAVNACKAQYNDCVDENKGVKDNGQCKTFAGDWVR